MGDVILGVDFGGEKARERFLRRRGAIGLSDLTMGHADPELSEFMASAGYPTGDTAPTEHVAPDHDCA